jgi:hypothetical protein
MLFLALPDDERTARLRADLAGRGVDVVGSSRLFTDGLERPWHAFQLDSDVGLAALLSAGEFLTLLRRLADDLLVGAAGPGGLLAEWTPGHANRWSVAAICALFPDSVVVVDESLAAELPDEVRRQVRVFDGDVDPLVPTPPPAVPWAERSEASEASELQDRLVVIVGCGRSGTTWLQQLWVAHDRVAGLVHNESWLFHQLRHLWSTFTSDGGFAAWTDRAAFVMALRRFCDGVLDCTRRRHGAPGADYVVEKTPVHDDRLDAIAAVYPDAWVVHVLRDGRDVARSITQVPFFEVDDLAAAAAMWDRAVTAVRRSQGGLRRFREVRYEDLRRDPVATMQTLWSWVGLAPLPPDDPALVTATQTQVSAHRSAEASRSRGLEPADLAKVYRAAGRTLVREGYASRSAVWRARLTHRGTR